MPEDVQSALERFQTFLGRFAGGEVIDQDSGFTVGDGMLLVGEVQTGHMSSDEESPID